MFATRASLSSRLRRFRGVYRRVSLSGSGACRLVIAPERHVCLYTRRNRQRVRERGTSDRRPPLAQQARGRGSLASEASPCVRIRALEGEAREESASDRRPPLAQQARGRGSLASEASPCVRIRALEGEARETERYRAGIPVTVVFAGTSFVTTAPAPMTASAPMEIPGRMVARAPMNARSATTTAPVSVTPGQTVT
jgi:hypothetical protein